MLTSLFFRSETDCRRESDDKPTTETESEKPKPVGETRTSAKTDAKQSLAKAQIKTGLTSMVITAILVLFMKAIRECWLAPESMEGSAHATLLQCLRKRWMVLTGFFLTTKCRAKPKWWLKSPAKPPETHRPHGWRKALVLIVLASTVVQANASCDMPLTGVQSLHKRQRYLQKLGLLATTWMREINQVHLREARVAAHGGLLQVPEFVNVNAVDKGVESRTDRSTMAIEHITFTEAQRLDRPERLPLNSAACQYAKRGKPQYPKRAVRRTGMSTKAASSTSYYQGTTLGVPVETFHTRNGISPSWEFVVDPRQGLQQRWIRLHVGTDTDAKIIQSVARTAMSYIAHRWPVVAFKDWGPMTVCHAVDKDYHSPQSENGLSRMTIFANTTSEVINHQVGEGDKGARPQYLYDVFEDFFETVQSREGGEPWDELMLVSLLQGEVDDLNSDGILSVDAREGGRHTI